MTTAIPASLRVDHGPEVPADIRAPSQLRSSVPLVGSIMLAAALALTIFTVRVVLVTMYAKSVPFYDEWGATVSFLAHGAAEGTIGIQSLMQPSNEHTIFFSRLLALLEFDLNQGQFDNVPAVLINAFLFAMTWAYAAFLFFRRLPSGTAIVGLAMAVAWIAPLGWENILTGFQSQFAFLILGALTSLWFAAGSQRMSPGHTVAFAFVNLAACPTMASGFFAPLVAAGVCLLRGWREPESRKILIARAAIASGATAFGVWLFQRTPHHYANADFGHVVTVFFSYLGWPYLFSPLVGILVSVPFILFAIRTLRSARPGALDCFALALGLWSAAQIAALALGRQTFGEISASRYLDVVGFWPLMNLYALARMVSIFGGSGMRFAVRFASLVWTAVFIGGVVARIAPTLEDIQTRSSNYREHTSRVAHYLRSGDDSVLKSTVFLALPYPSGRALKRFLDDPLVRDAMPAEVRAPLDLQSAEANSTFTLNGTGPATARLSDLRVFGSYGTDKDPTTGAFRSEPMQTRFPYLLMDLAGAPAAAQLQLNLVCEPEAACAPRRVVPNDRARQGWQQIVVAQPGDVFRVVASDANRSAWFGFDAPRELGSLSYAALKSTNLLRAEPYPALAAVSVMIACLTLLGWSARYRAVARDEEPWPCA